MEHFLRNLPCLSARCLDPKPHLWRTPPTSPYKNQSLTLKRITTLPTPPHRLLAPRACSARHGAGASAKSSIDSLSHSLYNQIRN